jgi:hypothetical protein
MTRALSMLLLICIHCLPALSQSLKEVALTKEEKQADSLLSHYQVFSDDSLASVSLYLYKHGTFEYQNATCITYRFSTGIWTKKGSIITLNSFIQKDQLPISINYIKTDSVGQKNKVLVGRSPTGERITALVVYMNNDSTSCIVGTPFCNGSYDYIDSIRVHLDGGFHSQWIKTERNRGDIEPVIQTTIPLEKYFPIRNEQYRLGNKQISRVKK